MPRPISVTVSLPAMRHNLAAVKNQLSRTASTPTRIWAVIKANAYGHGITQAMQAFAEADGLAMLDLDEAVRCREAGWRKPILMLEGYFEPADLPLYAEYGLVPAVHHGEQLDMLQAWQAPRALDAMLKLDTGMNRLGFQPDDYARAYERARQLQHAGKLSAVGKMTHFARADDDLTTTLEQLRRFERATAGMPGAASVCNSAATLTPGPWLDLGRQEPQWVRPGICLYGASPFAARSAASLDLQPAMTLTSSLISVRRVRAGEGIGYGHVFVAPHDMTVGTVACGYADGYPRHAPTGTPVTVAGRPCRLVGRVSMDMLIVDLAPVPGVAAGAPVVLWGEGGPSVDEVARAAGTIGYELLCAVAPRVPRSMTSLPGA